MKLTTVVLAILVSAVAAAPVGEDVPAGEFAPEDAQSIAAPRPVDAIVRVDGLRYRTFPKTSCNAPGQFAKGTQVKLACFKREGTTTVLGDSTWAKIAEGRGKGNWVAVANQQYVSWSGILWHC